MKKIYRTRASILCGAMLIAGLVVTPCYAQPAAGESEIQLSGGFFRAQGAESGTASADVSYGYYFRNPAWQLGLRQGLSYSFIDHGQDEWLATTIPFLNYHFYGLSKDDRFVPFVGGFVGAIWNDDDVTGTLGPTAGGKFFLNDHTFLMLSYRYEWFFNSFGFSGVTRNRADGNHVVTLGIGFLWD